MVQITKENYKDIPALILDNGTLKLTFLPEYGGKLASMIDKRCNRELLLQTPNEKYLVQPYDGDYTTGECSAFDDMFPTIDPVAYPDFPWKNAVMPDHGEVCALPWKYTVDGDSVTMTVSGVRFPYTLTKTVTFEAADRVKITYTAENRSPYPMDYIYAAHLMINVEDGGEILLPEAGKATWGFSRFPAEASYGDKLVWPTVKFSDGTSVDLSKTPAFDIDGNNYKFFLDEPLKAGWCGYRYADGSCFKLHFSPDELPAFCLWVNEGWFHGFRNIALEPCSAPYDRVDIARLHKASSVLPPFGKKEWTLCMECGAK
jgi:hypothetical protein